MNKLALPIGMLLFFLVDGGQLQAQNAKEPSALPTSVALTPSPSQQSPRASRTGKLIFRDRVTPTWFAEGTKFWYRNQLAEDKSEFVLVDAVKGTREVLPDRNAIDQVVGNDATIESTDTSTARRTGASSEVTFENQSSEAIEIFWVNGEGGRTSYGKINAGEKRTQHTYGGHSWAIVNHRGETLGVYSATDDPSTLKIDGSKLASLPPSRRRGPGPNRREDRQRSESPDGKWKVVLRDHNLFLQSEENTETPLSTDGTEEASYTMFAWSPDSRYLVAFRMTPGDKKEVHLIQSSPPNGGRAVLETRNYALPGDAFPRYEPQLFEISTRKQTTPKVDRFESEWDRPRIQWSPDGSAFRYEQIDRGHQRFRLIEIDVASGAVRNRIDEQAKTFVWTAHTENRLLQILYRLEKTDEYVYASEKSGWRHLYLVNTSAKRSKEGSTESITAITRGEWLVRGVDTIDEEKRQIWFHASGVYPDQDPYLIHYGRVNFDGTGLVWLTEGNGNHTLQYSPNRSYLIDSYSRVDAAPITELRRASDGAFLCRLETADTTLLEEAGRMQPEVFSAKGRDGKTDIWGIICRPQNMDPQKKYPVIEDIYAGPHGSFVPKSFTPSVRHEALTKLGFIVVQIDGMGTANRSKAFQDVCWKNLKDGGFEDRILWLRAAAQKYPELDLDRVGIYGTSAGGQNAAAALLFHPDFYKVGVAACGCHDNRMDKASWNEQWMGYPVGPHYSQCSNIDNAHRLKGKLFLIVGEMDKNVPPESTLRFADALIRADKDFDLLVVPNGGHGMGGAYGMRRMHQYFVQHLKP